jgi:hypothetical protein
MKTDLEEAMEIGDLREILEAMKRDGGYDLRTKRLMIEILASDVAWDSGTEKELDAGILSLIGNFFTAPGVDLNNAAARRIWIEAIFKAWCSRLWERTPTREELAQMFGEIIRAMGDDPKYGLPKRTGRTKAAKQPATILQLVTQGHEHSSEDKTDENKNSAD